MAGYLDLPKVGQDRAHFSEEQWSLSREPLFEVRGVSDGFRIQKTARNVRTTEIVCTNCGELVK
jgi:hypothetical protein